MPTILQAQCDRCGYASEHFSEHYGAVLVDDLPCDTPQYLVAGAALIQTSVTAQTAKSEDPRLLVLAHPRESDILANAGYTWRTVAAEGRYVAVQSGMCRSCGQRFDYRWLAYAALAGRSSGIGLGLVCGVIGGYAR